MTPEEDFPEPISPTEPDAEVPTEHPTEPPSATLDEALVKYGAPLPPEVAERVDQYVRALWAMNEKLNLTRHTDYDKFVARDLIDSMALAGLLKPGEEVLDLGTGGGVPGILIAILRPDVQVSLSDSVAKKASAVQDIVAELDLPIAVYHARGEEVLDDFRFDSVVCRAVAPLKKLLTWLEPHWLSVNKLLAIKGIKWVEERNEARHLGMAKKVEIRKVHEYETPGNDHPSVILKVWAKGRKEP